ncbi:MAG: hypothetical protein A2Z16_13030 [Chloroflexi bacterium RBG_16_54_18]|nr:MAG: hypothetical protein A2Z16_13030 [Chloroflexi bacterium RBG_16_54_18]
MTHLITFLFTDIQGSSQLWEQFPASMRIALARHDTLLKDTVGTYNGRIVKTTGDGLLAVFESAADGIAAALEGQRFLADENWPAETGPLHVRMGLHSGESQERDADYFGPVVNRAARIMSAGFGGQILLSSLTADLAVGQLPPDSSLLDLGEHCLRDLSLPEHLYQICHPQLEQRFPPLKTLAAYLHNLPVQLTSFIGREHELDEVKRLLDQTRLLTLLGPGGTGKTRLMLQAAAEVIDRYPDGVWFVELAALADPDMLAYQVASVLGVREQPGRPILEVLAVYLRTKQLLLLLDNVEHLVAECAGFSEYLLLHCPRTKIMVTGREALFISGETILQVPSLTLPESGERSLEGIRSSEAVRLLIARARTTLPDFELTQSNVPATVEIVRRLDGIPLAIELAAARLRMLTVEQIATRLHDLFRLLTGGSRTALPRQQTLQALIDWSWNLLDEPERILLRRLSVFSGGLTLEAAQAVAGFDGLDTFEGLEQLANKSLVAVDRLEGGQVRYHLLESIRQYARDRLFEAGEGEALRHYHAANFTTLILEAYHQVMGPDMLVWLKFVRPELDNIRAALEWAMEGDPELALQMSGRLFTSRTLWFSTSEARRWLEQSIAIGKSLSVAEDKVRQHQISLGLAMSSLTGINFGQGRNDEGVALGEQAVEILRLTGATEELAHALAMKGFSLVFTGQWEAAREASQEALDIASAHGFHWIQSMSLATLAWSEGISGQLDKAQSHLQKAMDLANQLGNPWIQGQTFMLQGRFLTQKGELNQAQASFGQAALLFGDLNDRTFIMVCKSEISHLLRRQGNYESALPIYKETIGFYQENGNLAAVAHQLECFAYLAIQSEQPERAAKLLGAARALRDHGHTESVVPWELDEFAQAMAYLAQAMGESERDAAVDEGRRINVDEVIAFAIGEN